MQRCSKHPEGGKKRAKFASIAADFSRIQFTPDLLPSDITGTSIYAAGEPKLARQG